MSIHFDRKNERWRYQFDRYVAGQRHRASRLLPKGWTRAQAQKYDDKETARLQALASGISEQQHLIDEAVLLYLTKHAPALKSFENIQRELWAFSEAYTGRPLDDLPEVAMEYASAMVGILAPATVRNRLAYLRAACRYAWKHHKLGKVNPAARMVVPKVNNARHFYWSRQQMLAICAQMPPGAKRAAVRVAFYSGMRVGEVVSAQVVADAFSLGQTKNGLPRLVPIHPRLKHIVRNPTLWPIPYTRWTVSKEFKKAARSAGFDEAVLHDMRHSTASEMVNGGADLYTVAGVLGHKSTVTTQRYSHLVQEKLAAAVGLVGKKSPTRPKASNG
jgi:integrase